jgi:hypothetical protein
MLKPLPRTIPFTKIKRLPERKAVTICLALMAQNGVVIAADAQESDQYLKRAQQKILTYMGPIGAGTPNPSPPSLCCAFTGAGNADYLDAFFEFAIKGITTKATRPQLEEFLADKIKVFHEQHLFPLALAYDPPTIDVLIGAYCTSQTCVFATHGSTMRSAIPYAAVGAGGHFAMSLMGGLPFPIDVKHAEILAAYVISATKEQVEFCGKYTAIVTLRNAEITGVGEGKPAQLVAPKHPLTHVAPSKIRRWEQSFATKWAKKEAELFQELIEEELSQTEEED